MTIGNAESSLTYGTISWFRAGDLAVTGDYDKPLSYSGIDNYTDILPLLNNDPQYITRIHSQRQDFFWDTTVVGKYPVKCLPFLVAGDIAKEWSRVSSLAQNGSGTCVKSFAPRNLVEEVFGVVKDPETLDDSEIEELMYDSTHENVQDEEAEKAQDPKLRESYLIVTRNSVYEVGDAIPTLIYGGIDDCQVFHTSENTLESVILVTIPTGFLLAILLVSHSSVSYVTQYWDLGSDGLWRIIRNECNNQFLVIHPQKGVLRFFEFKDQLHFQLVNNLNFDNTIILDCTFFPNTMDSHYLLFVAAIQYERLIYYCIEWDESSPTLKKVHYLTYLTDQKFRSCSPVGNQKVLIFYDGVLELVTANQLMSGETSFARLKSNFIESVCDCFPAPLFLKKLKKLDKETFGCFDYSMIFGTSSGYINVCMVDRADQLEIFSLTRFKGLKSLCAVRKQADDNEQYDMIVVSYGRTLKISIDTSQIKRVTGHSPVASFSALTFKHTMDSSMEESSQMIIVEPSKLSGRFSSELWLTSPTSITHLKTSSPAQKLYKIFSSQQVFDEFEVIQLNCIAPNLRSRLLQTENDLDTNMYLLLGVDSSPSLRSFTLDFSDKEPALTEIEDLLIKVKDSRACFLTSKNIIQITATEIYSESLDFDQSAEPVRVDPGWKIEGATHLEDLVIIWNTKERQVWYAENIDELSHGKPFKKTFAFDELMNNQTDERFAKFHITKDDHDQVLVYMSGGDALIQIPWEALDEQNKVPIASKEIRTGHVDSIVSLSHWLCCIRNGRDILLVNHQDYSVHSLDLGFNGREIRLRKVDETTCLVFSNDEIVTFTLSSTGDWNYSYVDLKLPYQWKLNPILDVQLDKAHYRAFVSYSHGLHAFDMSYFSWNRAKYLLHCTRDINKKFIFIRSINRMLVANFDSRKWDCIKLTDGKTKSLDPSVLQEKCGRPRDVVEIPCEGKNIALLLGFDHLIKLVYLLPEKGNIVVAEHSIHRFEEWLFPSIKPGVDNKYYFLTIKDGEAPNNSMAKLVEAKVDDGRIMIISEFSFHIKDATQIQEFQIFGNDLIIQHATYNRIFIMRRIFNSAAKKRMEFFILETPPGTKHLLTYPMNDDSFIIVIEPDKSVRHVSELHFYHRCDMVSPTCRIDTAQAEGQGQLDIFEQALASIPRVIPQSAPTEPTPTALEVPEDDDMDEMDERDAFGTPNEALPAQSPLNDHEDSPHTGPFTKPYRTIKLDKGVKDIKYDKTAEKLYVLATDDSVIVFRPTQLSHLSISEEPNSGYKIPNTRHISQAYGTPYATGLFPIDKYGQI